MPKRGEREFLYDILEAIRRIESYIGEISYEEFLQKTMVQDAIVRNLEIIGEAVKNLSFEFKQEHHNIEWKDIAGMRDKIIHFYFGVKWSIVWDVIKNKLPVLKDKINRIIKEESGN